MKNQKICLAAWNITLVDFLPGARRSQSDSSFESSLEFLQIFQSDAMRLVRLCLFRATARWLVQGPCRLSRSRNYQTRSTQRNGLKENHQFFYSVATVSARRSAKDPHVHRCTVLGLLSQCCKIIRRFAEFYGPKNAE